MLDWIRKRIARWGWIAFERTQRLNIIDVSEYRSVHVHYTYNGDVEIAVCNKKPFKLIAKLKVAYPNLNTVELTKYLEYEEAETPELTN